MVYSFACAGLIAKTLKKMHNPDGKEHKLKWVDQWGNNSPNPKAAKSLAEDGVKPAEQSLLAQESNDHNQDDGDEG